MLVGYTRSTILPSLDFWLGLHTTLHFSIKQNDRFFSHIFFYFNYRQCSVVTITVAEDVKILSGPTLDICGLSLHDEVQKIRNSHLGPFLFSPKILPFSDCR